MTDPRPLDVAASLAKLAEARDALLHANPPAAADVADPELSREALAAEAAEVSAERRAARWAQVCPQRFLGATWAWVAAEHGAAVVETLQAWGQRLVPPNLVLLGPVGTGKTAAALLACKAGQLDHGQGVAFYPEPELLDMLRPGGPDDALERMQAAARLVIDDMGTSRPTDWTAERMGVLVNRRWMEERPTVVTANLGPDQLREAVGERIYSRLVGGATVLNLGGEDRRRRRA